MPQNGIARVFVFRCLSSLPPQATKTSFSLLGGVTRRDTTGHQQSHVRRFWALETTTLPRPPALLQCNMFLGSSIEWPLPSEGCMSNSCLGCPASPAH